MSTLKSKITQGVYKVLPKRHKLVMLDSFFPNLNSGFKINEFNYLLDHFPGSEVYSYTPDFKNKLQVYLERFPQYKGRVKEFTSKKLYFASLFYVCFLHNMFNYLPFVEREHTPFAFSLHCGGQFGLNYPESDAKLKAICGSPMFRKVIVSQNITATYLVEKGFCTADQIELVYGAVLSENVTKKRYLTVKKKYYPEDKKTFDVCFVARRQTPQGKDKGYHLFIEAAKKIAATTTDIRFHVVGNFDIDTIPVGRLASKITFHGTLPIDTLPEFFETQDVYLSPNIPNIIHPGSFEGITGTCQEAAVAGTAVFLTDVLKLNMHFTHKKDVVFLEPDADKIALEVMYYYRHLPQLYEISKKGQKKFLQVFDFKKHVSHIASVLKPLV